MPHKLNRRQFLGQASCAAVGSTSLFSTLLNLRLTGAAAAEALQPSHSAKLLAANDDYKALVCILLAGGNDSFNMLVPRDNANYNEYAAIRADLALSQGVLLPINPTNGDGREYGVHPAMPEVAQLFEDGRLIFAANVGALVEPTTKADIESGLATLPLGLYSHSDQIMHWQTSVPDKRARFGWGGRTADLLQALNSNNTFSMNISLAGSNLFQTGTSVAEYSIVSWGNGAIQVHGHDDIWWSRHILQNAAIESMLDLTYQNLFEQTFVDTTRSAMDGSELFAGAIENVPPFAAQFSDNQLSNNLAMVAKTIAARQTLGFRRQTFFVMFGGWDHHDEVLDSQMAMLSVVSKALKEFDDALTELGVQNQVTTFTASDFGRTLTSNGQGSDHAWGGNHMVMGGVNGRKIYGEYPALYEDNPLDTGRGRLIPTISCDEYFAELALWFGAAPSELATVFPNIGRFYDPISGPHMPIGFLNRGLADEEIVSQVYLPIAIR
ncbi:MAG: DUF1501 domain-containing protein [Chloroflexi bacterium]|nr:DUF1501 domain-containing protein [Chloroflexota bacterium]